MFDKLKNILNGEDEDEYEEDDVYMEEDDVQESTTAAYEDEQPPRAHKTVNINTPAPNQLKVVLVKPERFDDASMVADHLNEKRTVVLNLESTNKEVSRRLVDFLSGVAYANNGKIKRVANSTFIITPYNVVVMGDILDELESTQVNNGVFF